MTAQAKEHVSDAEFLVRVTLDPTINLTPMDEARLFHYLKRQGVSVKKIGKLFARSQTTVRKRLNLMTGEQQ